MMREDRVKRVVDAILEAAKANIDSEDFPAKAFAEAAIAASDASLEVTEELSRWSLEVALKAQVEKAAIDAGVTGDPLDRVKEELAQSVDRVERLSEALAIRHDQYREIREANIRLGEQNAKLREEAHALLEYADCKHATLCRDLSEAIAALREELGKWPVETFEAVKHG